MTNLEIGIIAVLLILSVALLVCPAVMYLIRKSRHGGQCERSSGSTAGGLLVVCAYMLGSIWCLRYAVGFFLNVSSVAVGPGLAWWEEAVSSLLRALQTFGVDGEYTSYILGGKEMLRQMLGESTLWGEVFAIYSSALSVLAPVAGGAVVFELLASIFPQIRLWLANRNSKCERYYFSKLNDSSLAVAQSVYKAEKAARHQPVLIFADGEDMRSDLLQEAKAIGAICLGDDLSHIKKSKKGVCKFFLIDECGTQNMKALADLADECAGKHLKGQEIFFFTNDDAYILVEKRIREKLVNQFGFTDEEMPVFNPVRCNRNLISNLLVDVPLYEPLVGRKGNSDLTVTILGGGEIGTEMFLSAYWFGQMLDHKLHINVVSQQSEAEFWGKIDYINPEIKHTTIPGDPILRVNRQGQMAPVYCSVGYRQQDVRSSAFMSALSGGEDALLNTDYFLVALGSDEENIAAANQLRRFIQRHHMNKAQDKKTVIAYVVYNTEMADILNRNRHYGYKKGICDVYMCAVGNLRDVYSVKNVFMSEHEAQATKSAQAYDSLQSRDRREKAYISRMKDEYNHWSDRARAMHAKYKLFSMGLINFSVFGGVSGEDATYLQALKDTCDTFGKLFSPEHQFATEAERDNHMSLMHKMAWLEKRRWNAFIRTMGFMGTDQYDCYAVKGEKSTYKQMDIRLHPCLLECDQKGIRSSIDEKCQVDAASLLSDTDEENWDRLDELSHDLFKKGYNQYDFKQYDYLLMDIGSVAELAEACRRKISKNG